MAPEKNQYWGNIVNAVTPDLNKVSRLPLAADDPDSGDDIDAALMESHQYLRSYKWRKSLGPQIYHQTKHLPHGTRINKVTIGDR